MGFLTRTKRRDNNDAMNSTQDASGLESESAPVCSELPSLEGFKSQASVQDKVAHVNAEVQLQVRADVVFNLLADPNQHPSIFEAIEGAQCRLLEEDGPWRKYELDYQARWKFWRVGGVCENRLFMETHADHGTVSFRLREPGFLRVYEGTWVISPAGQSALNLHARKQKKQQQPVAVKVQQQVSAPVKRSPSPSPAEAASASARLPWSGLFSSMFSGMFSVTNPFATPQPAGAGHAGPLASITSPWGALQQHMGALHQPLSRTLSIGSLDGSTSSSSSSYEGGDSPACGAAMEPPPLPAQTVVRVQDLRMGPKVAPPYPLGGLLKNHAVNQVEDMMKGLLAAAQRLQAQMPVTPPTTPPSTPVHRRLTAPAALSSPGSSITNASSAGASHGRRGELVHVARRGTGMSSHSIDIDEDDF